MSVWIIELPRNIECGFFKWESDHLTYFVHTDPTKACTALFTTSQLRALLAASDHQDRRKWSQLPVDILAFVEPPSELTNKEAELLRNRVHEARERPPMSAAPSHARTHRRTVRRGLSSSALMHGGDGNVNCVDKSKQDVAKLRNQGSNKNMKSANHVEATTYPCGVVSSLCIFEYGVRAPPDAYRPRTSLEFV